MAFDGNLFLAALMNSQSTQKYYTRIFEFCILPAMVTSPNDLLHAYEISTRNLQITP